MELYNVVVAEDNPIFAEMFRKEIEKTKDMQLVGIANNGKDAVKLVLENQPDILILDVILPQLDGAGVANAIKQSNIEKQPVIIAISSFLGEAFIEQIKNAGVEYFMCREISYDIILERARSYVKQSHSYHVDGVDTILPKREEGTEPDYYQAVTMLLHNIGIPANLKGYEYLRRAVMLSIEDSTALSGITKFLYPKIAYENKTSPSNIERAIRHAIEVSYDRSDSRVYVKLFKPIVNKRKGRPTNSEVIATLAEYVVSYA